MLDGVLHSEDVRLRKLKVTRESVWNRFKNNPSEIQLAAKLKVVDDQIAQTTKPWHLDAVASGAPEVASVSKVGGLFLILAVSPRKKSNPKFAF